jgi:hypothetical protein
MGSSHEPQQETRPPGPHAVLAVLLGVAALAVFLALARTLWPFTVDDTFITLRYARNLAAGSGPTFNPGVPTEGCTTFLWMVLLAASHALGLDALAFAKGLGVLATLALLGATSRLAHELTLFLAPGRRLVPPACAALLLAAFVPTAVHAVSGMETALFAALLTAFFVLATRHLGAPASAGARGLALLSLALGLARPEGNLAALLVLGTTAALLPRAPRLALLRTSALLYVLPGVLYFTWRFAYYGYLLPLPYYVKVWDQVPLAGALTVLAFLGVMAVHFGALVLLGLLRFDRRMLPAFAATAGLLAFFLFPRPTMTYNWRYLFPVTPLLVALAARGLAVATDRLECRPLPTLALLAAPVLALVVATGLLSDAPRVTSAQLAYARGLDRAHVALGRALAPLARRAGPAPLVALSDAGAVPYYSDWRALDLFGLNEPSIALTGSRDPAWVMARHPDVIVLVSTSADRFVPLRWNTYEAPILRACLAGGMARIARFTFEPGGYFLWAMADPGGPAGRALAGARP